VKKSAIVILFLLAMLKAQSQDYLINFVGTGASTTVDSVQVRNLTQNTSLTLNGTDVLHLMLVVGINPASESVDRNLRIYPNPINENSFIEFEATSSGYATIDLFNVAGKQVAHTQKMLQGGRHTFAISGLSSGMYTLNIRSSTSVNSGKIACTRTGSGNPKISYISSVDKPETQSKLKSLQAVVPMQYNNGDQLLFKFFSGIYATVIPLVPTQSQTVTSNFVACTDADNNNYATVTIGIQVWMAENLKVGIRIDGIQDQTNNSIIEKYCYNNDEANCAIYGGLYQRNEMMQYVTTPGLQGICPTGWHLPTDGEWCTVTQFLDPTVDCSVWSMSGANAGGKMKSSGTIEAGTCLWYSPNTGATNESGFTAVPAGSRDTNGAFINVGNYGLWWSSSENIIDITWSRVLAYNDSRVYRGSYWKYYGFSVRCLKNN